MITKEALQRFIDIHASDIGEILPGGLKNKDGKWLLVCPVMERFNLDFSKVNSEKAPVKEEVKEVVEEKPAKKGKKSTKKK